MAGDTQNKRKRQAILCPHCDQQLSKSAYYEHRNLYYLPSADDSRGVDFGEWLTESPADRGEEDTHLIVPDAELVGGGSIQYDSSSDSASSTDMSEHDSTTDEDEDMVEIGIAQQGQGLDEADPEVWPEDEVREEYTAYAEPSTDLTNEGSDHSVKVVRCILVMVLAWQTVCNIPDRAVILLLRVFRYIFVSMYHLFQHAYLFRLFKLIPLSLATVRRRLQINRDSFVKYVSCPTCHSIYKYSEAYETRSTGRKVSKRCTYTHFSRHVMRSHRKPCGTILLKTVRCKNGQESLLPKRVFCYRSLKESISELVKREDFVKHCKKWMDRGSNGSGPAALEDIYDGRVWKSFQSSNGNGFLDSEHNFLLTLNVDWFQPHKHCADTVGAMYLVVQNLPRTERYKYENIIIVGIIPGPKEPKYTMNCYLDPLVDELLELWDGIHIEDGTSSGNLYRAALTCLSADIPASRKCGGFVGHGAKKGCTKCLKEFGYLAEHNKTDYSGFVPDESLLRNNETHKAYALRVKNAPNRNQQKQLEREHGARYSELFRLPYYCPITYTVIDPMHNLLLGTAKHIHKVWKKLNITDARCFKRIQRRVDAMKMPNDVGRIPGKIESGFSGFTAQQWKIWVCSMSAFALKDIIEEEHYQIWIKFVEACEILCSKVITFTDLDKGQEALIEFCTRFDAMYGKKYCTINMHLHLHLKECILDFGPVYSFWCFSFERYNGILGASPTNNKLSEVGVQVMRRFIQGRQLRSLPDSDVIMGLSDNTSEELYSDLFSRNSMETVSRSSDLSNRLAHSFSTTMLDLDFAEDNTIHLLPPERRKCLSCTDVEKLLILFGKMYPASDDITIFLYCEFADQARVYGETFGVASSRFLRSSCAQAKWFLPGNDTEASRPDLDAAMRPCKIKEIFRCQVKVREADEVRIIPHLLARVEWFAAHPQQYYFEHHAEVWSREFEESGNAEFIPLQRLAWRCAVCEYRVYFPFCRATGEKVNIVIPVSSDSMFE